MTDDGQQEEELSQSLTVVVNRHIMWSVSVMVTWTVCLSFVFCLVSGKQDNFCRPLEDYGPRSDIMEDRQVCQTSFEKNCQPVTVSDCMDVTELRCQVKLFTNCTMDWQMKDSVESLMSVSIGKEMNKTENLGKSLEG